MRSLLIFLVFAFTQSGLFCQNPFRHSLKTTGLSSPIVEDVFEGENVICDSFIVGSFQVVPDTNSSGTWLANTGLSYDKGRRLIYSSVTPQSWSNIIIFNEAYDSVGTLPIIAQQGHAYDLLNDQILVWFSNNQLRTYEYDGTLVNTQSDFRPYPVGNNAPGMISFNYTDTLLYVSADGGTDVKIMSRSGNDWVLTDSLGVSDAEEGVAYDEDSNAVWYNTNTQIKKVDLNTKAVTLTIDQPGSTLNAEEGLAYNPFRNTLYINADTYYHGKTPNGNICVEVCPTFSQN